VGREDPSAPGSWLGLLDATARAALLARGTRRRYAGGETIFLRGDPGRALYLIEEGRVEVSVTALGGRRSVLAHMGPGEILGEIAVLDNLERSADATAAGEVALVGLPRSEVMDFLARNPEAMMGLIAELCAKARNASEMFEDQTQVAARTRLARCLTRIARKWGQPQGDGAVRITEPLSQSDLGEFSGLARENVNRHLRAFADEGLLRIEDGVVLIGDVEALEEIAEL
jgi:CRP-like cAMP-binding protein